MSRVCRRKLTTPTVRLRQSDRTALGAPNRPTSSGRAEDATYRTGIATCRSVSFQSTITAIGATSGTWGSRKS
jgi:hypothetical protein